MQIDNNHVRLGLVISALIVSLSIGYYLVIFLPEERRTAITRERLERNFKKELECQEVFDKLRKRANNVVKVRFSSIRNACMATIVDGEGQEHESKVSDLTLER